MAKEYKFTQKQFDWLIDTVNSPLDYSEKVRDTAAKLLKAYGFKGWYTDNGKMALQMLTHMVRNEKKQREVDDLPF
jgi:hypothetical protein